MNFLVASEDSYYTKIYQKLKEILMIQEEEMPCVRIFQTTFTLIGA